MWHHFVPMNHLVSQIIIVCDNKSVTILYVVHFIVNKSISMKPDIILNYIK